MTIVGMGKRWDRSGVVVARLAHGGYNRFRAYGDRGWRKTGAHEGLWYLNLLKLRLCLAMGEVERRMAQSYHVSRWEARSERVPCTPLCVSIPGAAVLRLNLNCTLNAWVGMYNGTDLD